MKNLPAIVAILAVSSAGADTIYVDANCPGPGNGSEAEPYCSIQTAIDNAVDTDEIVVAPGTYFESIIFLGKAITLRSSAGPDVTVIDGVGNFHVVQCVSGEGSDTVLAGFTITGGDANGDTFQDATGGGMSNVGSSPTVSDCVFTGNNAGVGGGMFNRIGSSPTVADCIFTGNSASYSGGGMYNRNSSPAVTNCTFSGNMSASAGGGMTNYRSSPTVTNCSFEGNTANFGGGMINSGNISSPTVTGCTFTGNTAVYSGGGMHSGGDSPTVTNCTFSGNTAGRFGGGMANDFNSSPLVINCTFSGNSSNNIGGGLFTGSSSSSTVANCVLWGDSPDEISGSGTLAVTYTDVQGGFPGTGNIDADPMFVDSDNGDFRLQPGSPCIDAGDNTAVPVGVTTDLDGNPRFLEIPETPDSGLGTLPIVDMGAYESLGGGCLAVMSQEVLCHSDGTTFTVNIEGLNACTGGTTQVTFTAAGGAVGEELCFTALVNDGGFCCSTEICVTIPDCTPAALPSDLDGDGTVGMTDFLALLGAWGPCSDCGTPQACPADFDGDCAVGILDLLILLANWA